MTSRLGLRRLVTASLVGAALAFAGLAALADDPPKEGFSPDPPGHASAKWWRFDVAVAHGVPAVARVLSVNLPQPAETPRVVGRFALELYVGPELLDRVRFDVPLMGSGPAPKSPRHPFPRPSFDDVSTRLEVRMADHPRAAYAVLIDRSTRVVRRYEWPPDALGHLVPWTMPVFGAADASWAPPASSADAGSRDAATGG